MSWRSDHVRGGRSVVCLGISFVCVLVFRDASLVVVVPGRHVDRSCYRGAPTYVSSARSCSFEGLGWWVRVRSGGPLMS